MFKLKELIKATEGILIGDFRDFLIKGISIDSRTIKRQQAFVAIKGKNFDGHDFIKEAIAKGASCVIIEKLSDIKTKIPFIKVKDTIKALGDIARFQRRRFDLPVIAVTGSNGKTTTKEMLAFVLSRRFKVLKNEGTKNNQIGLPLSLFELSHNYKIAVLELGTNHIGEIDYLSKICLPNLGIITNIGPSHLEYLGSLEGVFKEKYSLIENLKEPYLGFLNADDRFLRTKIDNKTLKPFIISFGIKNNADFSASKIKVSQNKVEFQVNQKYKVSLNTLGYHNVYNTLAVIAVARIFGLNYKEIILSLKEFQFPAGRLRLIKLNNINFIDDTYNSNPLSLREALNTLRNLTIRGRKIFIMGDMLELGNLSNRFHYQAGPEVASTCDVLITVGELSRLTAEMVNKLGFNRNNIFICNSSMEARDVLFNKITPDKNDIVLVKGSRAIQMERVFRK
ncbi:MAG: UDP-N-acetylmuramoyl-tripeptide--D-alanyl-D-alanine ligase [Candidatus Omnitrophica bacterium]|nr:UDP-N-acetylmuramoyl-tripeptide--D-alanyl-D-alanine ligase [Candidatus Omnitrophota bacterium]